ncbi:type VI secretion system tip protein VgrG [Caballeronia sp. LjRoot29]|uniref:type VI secretion system Vgr family protein n=1 Tax=Caballeronia sp. LjRoot29 TaxID=3342315 RepID=UPI003ED05035
MDQKAVFKHWHYRLDMPQTRSADLADILEFEGERAIGESSRYVIRFTHPQPDLSHTDYLNRPATLVIQTPFNPLAMAKPEPERRVQGVLTGFSHRGSNRDETTYEVVLESRLSLLRNVPKCRFFLNQSFPETIEQILREHGFDRIHGGFEFNLYREYRKRDFVMQWNEDDLSFITRLCRRSGIWFVCEEGKRCENVRFGDDFTHYRRDLRLEVPYRAYSGLESSGAESVNSLKMNATTLAASYKVRTFSTENQLSEPIEAASEITQDGTTYGEAYTWGTPDLNQSDAAEEALLRQEAAIAAQVEYQGTCTILDLAPGCILKLSNRELPDAKYGMLAVRVKCSASRKQAYRAEFTAIPSTLQLQLPRQYRLPLLESTWPRIEGVITGTIASPSGYKNPYLDKQGSYIVHLHADQDKRTPGLQSCPMRLAKPFAGAGQTGFHFGLVEGTIVTVGFLWGCPDLPFISQVLHTAQHTDPVNSTYPWGTRNTLRTRSNNTLQMEDGQGREHIKLATEHSKSQLNLGHSVDRSQSERGHGAELRTDMQAIVRGGAGAMVTAYARSGGGGHQLDMQETIAQLKDMLALAQTLAQSAEASKASPADTGAQKAINDALDKLKQPVVLVTAPGPVGVVSGDGVQLAADGSIIATAKKGVHFSTLKRFTVAARDMVSLFTQKGMSLIAAAGNVVVQAQRGRMQLASQEDMSVESVNGVVHVKAAKEIILNVDGTYVKISGGGVEIGSRGGVLYRTAGVKGTGPAQMDLSGAAFSPRFVPYTTACEVWRTNPAFVPPPAPAPEMGAAENMVAPAPDAGGVAPTLLGDFFSRKTSGGVPAGASAFSPFDAKPSNVDSGVPKAKVTLSSPGDQQPAYVAPDPIKLVNAVPCDWKISDLKADVQQHIEAKSYWGMLDNRTPWMNDDKTVQYRGGGSRDSNYEFAYSEQDKAITCTVRVMTIPMDLFPVNLKGERDTSVPADEATIPYEFSAHSQMTPGIVRQGAKMDYRDAVGPKFDVRALISRIEAVLNQGGYKLILDGCSKGAACGCRVKVNFKVDLRVSIKGTPIDGFSPHVSLKLFPFVLRADTGSWGEKHKYKQDRKILDYPDANVEAHECGHYFNFPDEYYGQGGWLHESYIKNEQIDFSLVDAKAGAMVWQGHSQTDATYVGANVMGDGANAALQGGRVTAAIKPYYLEYVRRQFSLATNKLWRVGYDS